MFYGLSLRVWDEKLSEISGYVFGHSLSSDSWWRSCLQKKSIVVHHMIATHHIDHTSHDCMIDDWVLHEIMSLKFVWIWRLRTGVCRPCCMNAEFTEASSQFVTSEASISESGFVGYNFIHNKKLSHMRFECQTSLISVWPASIVYLQKLVFAISAKTQFQIKSWIFLGWYPWKQHVRIRLRTIWARIFWAKCIKCMLAETGEELRHGWRL